MTGFLQRGARGLRFQQDQPNSSRLTGEPLNPAKLNEIGQRLPRHEVPVVGGTNIKSTVTVEPFADTFSHSVQEPYQGARERARRTEQDRLGPLISRVDRSIFNACFYLADVCCRELLKGAPGVDEIGFALDAPEEIRACRFQQLLDDAILTYAGAEQVICKETIGGATKGFHVQPRR